MATEKQDLAATRERLELLLETDGRAREGSPSAGNTRQAFLAGAAFSGLVASSIFLTGFIDSRLHDSETTNLAALSGATNGGIGQAIGFDKRVTPEKASQLGSTSLVAMSAIDHRRTRVNAPILNGAPSLGPASVVTRGIRPHSGDAVQSSTVTSPVNTHVDRQVLVPVAGLSTSRSVITGVVDPQTMTASYYWTFTLKNQTNSSKEAQMNIALPNGAVVSRATLWINGKAEEAAFNTTSQVQNAYDWIVTRNRDPLLITQTPDGNINLKASPVMPNKEMKIRIGITAAMQMTADGQSQAGLPHVIDANLDVKCIQNVHITCDAPLVSNDARMNSPVQKHGFLLRGNVDADGLQKLQITAQRDQNLRKFATRATHSNPPSYIVAELQQDNQGLSILNLSKSITKPDCPILKDDHAAFRLSYLWVKTEIENLVRHQEIYQAEQLATVYRVVSPVSGAVVLERQTDYDYNGLDRNLYKSLAYEPRSNQNDDSLAGNYSDGFSSQLPQPESDSQRAVPAPKAPAEPSAQAAPSAVPVPAPMATFDKSASQDRTFDARSAVQARVTRRRSEHNSEQPGISDFRKAGKIAVGLVETKTLEKASIANSLNYSQQKSADTESHSKKYMAMNAASTRTEGSAGGSISEQTINSPASYNAAQTLFNGSDNLQAARLAGPAGSKIKSFLNDANMLFDTQPIGTVALVFLLALTFSGGFALYAIAALRLYRREPGATKVAACGAIWFAVAAFSPLFSQVFTILLATGLTFRAALNSLKPKR